MPEPYGQILIGLAAAALIALIAGRLGALSPSGAWAAFVLGTVVFGVGGAVLSLPLITFFTLSSLLSQGTRRWRSEGARLESIFEKGSRRDAVQVFANGGIAGVIVLLIAFTGDQMLWYAYAGALGAAAADTWATEIGVHSSRPVVSIRTFKAVPRGTSGGISLIGTAAAIAGAFSVALSIAFFTPQPLYFLIIVTAAGLLGSTADSLAGATIQRAYRCSICGTSTERPIHHDQPAILQRGYSWVTNDVVNLICTASGAAVAIVLAALV
jgi:uncharacterized protein (TIGR00297 family)